MINREWDSNASQSGGLIAAELATRFLARLHSRKDAPVYNRRNMDNRTEAQLATVMPDLADRVRAAAAALAAQGTYILIPPDGAFRTAARQNQLYEQGRSLPGHIVTNAQAGQSMHNFGLAVDVVPYLSGPGSQPNWRATTPQFMAMVAAMKAEGLYWGGDWRGRLADFDHFQLDALPATPSLEMQADYKATIIPNATEHIANLWQKVARGDYAVELS